MIYIEGPRNAGKTYLLDKYLKENPNKFFTYKFPYYDLYEKLDLEKELNAGTYFSFGKDLDLLSLAKMNLLPNNIILDRGFISTIIFAMIFRGAKEEQMTRYIELIKEKYQGIKIDIVYVVPNTNKRDSLGLSEGREKDTNELPSLNLVGEPILDSTYTFKYNWVIEQLLNQPNIAIHKFINNFDEESINSFNYMLNMLYKG